MTHAKYGPEYRRWCLNFVCLAIFFLAAFRSMSVRVPVAPLAALFVDDFLRWLPQLSLDICSLELKHFSSLVVCQVPMAAVSRVACLQDDTSAQDRANVVA